MVREAYPHLFSGRRVLEVGSYDLNGSVRPYFEGCDYTGLDWRPGPGVDVVCLAHEFRASRPFDVVISASMLEHDPFWPLSLANMINLLTEHGALLLSWGTAENQPHCVETAPDGQFHPRPGYQVLDLLDRLGLYVERCQYEAQIGFGGTWEGLGLVAFRSRADGLGTALLTELRLSDRRPLPAGEMVIGA
jgi:hypothetical protein